MDNKTENFSAYFLQATGHLVPDEHACGRCKGVVIKKPYVGGVFVGCVVFSNPEEAKLTGGACANCWFGRQGSRCQFRNPAGRPSRKERQAYLYEQHQQQQNARSQAQIWNPSPSSLMSPPALPEGQGQQQFGNHTATGQVHPAFLASVSSTMSSQASPAPVSAYTPSFTTSTSDYPHIDAQIAHQRNGEPPLLPPPQPRPTGLPGIDANTPRATRIAAWEARYRKMESKKLRSTHKHLIEWQEDLSARLMAMNKVLLDRLEKREGQHTLYPTLDQPKPPGY